MFVPKILSVIVLALAAGSAGAEKRLQPLQTRADLLGWEAIGRLDLGSSGYCSAALIAPDQVLTAAHCVFDKDGQQIAAAQITFRAGYVDGDALAERQIDHLVVDATYIDEPGGKIDVDRMRHDVALLRLSSPILSDVADPFVVHVDAKIGDEVSVLSYGRGRSEHLSWQRDCAVIKRVQGILVFDCNVTFSSSGAPVFVRYGNRMRILSVVSASGALRSGQDASFGMELPAAVAELKRRMRAAGPSTAANTQGIKRIRVGTRVGNGAKFVRSHGG